MVSKTRPDSSKHFSTDSKYEIGTIGSADDLDKLISLAEDVSDNLHHMDAKASNLKQKSLWVVGITYMLAAILAAIISIVDITSFGRAYELLFISGIAVALIPICILFINIRRNVRRIQNDIRIEASVLQELLDMVHELENASRYRSMIDPVSSAAFRMRLKRLHFAVD